MAGWSILKYGSSQNCTQNLEIIKDNDGCCFDNQNDMKWDDFDDKLHGLFNQVLMVLFRGVYAKSGIRPIPALLGDGRSVDLIKLFCMVRKNGGFNSVSSKKLWGFVAEKCGFDCRIAGSLKLIYFKYLDELDQLLNRISKDRVLGNGSYDFGGNFWFLSLELEKRFRDFSDGKEERVKKERKIVELGFDEVCKHVDMVLKDSLRLPGKAKDEKMDTDMGETEVDDDEKTRCDDKNFGKPYQGIVERETNSRKRKRDTLFVGMVSWMSEVAKNPCDSSIGCVPGFRKWKEKKSNEFWSLSLSAREAMFRGRYVDLDDDRSHSKQKQKMHPDMYEDDCILSNGHLENEPKKREIVGSNSNPPHVINEKTHPSPGDLPVEKHVSVGPLFQADVPDWTSAVSESDPKWLGTKIWSPNFSKNYHIGKGRSGVCECTTPGTVECVRFHVAERRMKLRHELGLAFYHWKFDGMGEEASLSWSVEEENKFKEVISLNLDRLGKSFFPTKTRKDLVSYYYDVFLIRRISYQNRVTPKDIDSDDDEKEFGYVGERFGSLAVRAPGSELLSCSRNEQCTDFD